MKSTERMSKALLEAVLIILLLIFTLAGEALAQVCVQPPSDLVSWWPGDGNANDIQDGNSGKVIGNVTFASGKVNQGFNLPGGVPTPSRVEGADAPNLQITGPLTLDAWVSFRGVSPQTPTVSNSPIVAKWGDSTRGTAGYGLFVYANGEVAFAVSPDGSSVTAVSSSTILSSTFTHVAGVWTGSQLQLYVNGVLEATTQFVGPIFVNTGIPLLIGGYDPAFTNGPDSMIGVIDEVQIFTSALSASQIQAIFNAASHSGSGTCSACAATLSSAFALHIPILSFNNQYFRTDFQYVPNTINFTLTDAGGVTDLSPYTACSHATLSSDFKLLIPDVIFNGSSYWLDLTYTQGVTFTVTGAGQN